MVIEFHWPEIFQPFFEDKYRYKVAEGGRGSAKTETVGRMFLQLSFKTSGTILCLREIQKSIETSVYSLFKRLIGEHGMDSLFDVQAKKIINRISGAEIIFYGLRDLTVDNIKSIDNVKYCWVEEAHNVTQNSWDTLRPSVRGTDSEIWITFNRKRPNDPVWNEFCSKKDSEVLHIHADYNDNPFFPDVLEKERQRDFEKRSTDVYDHIWHGKPLVMEGLIYPSFERSKHLFPASDCLKIESRADNVIIGLDWGYDHPMAMVKIVKSGERYYLTSEYNQRNKIINLRWIFDDFMPMSDRVKQAICDSSRPDLIKYCDKDYRQDLSRLNGTARVGVDPHNTRFMPCIKYPGSVLDEINLVNRLFQDGRLFVSDELAQLIKELEQWAWKSGLKNEAPEDLGEDTCRAMGYGLMYLEKTGKNQITVL